MSAIEIITSTEKRRYWTRAEKRRWVLALSIVGAGAQHRVQVRLVFGPGT